jgi:DNA-binding response OmpR family regulator
LSRDLRARGYAGPIVFLATQIDISAKLAAFEAGADDYILEPVAPQELLARVQAVARRYAQEDHQPMGTILRAGDAELSVADLTLRIAGRAPVRLTPTEMRILECLMRNAGLAVNRETLIERVWGYDFFGVSNRVDVYIRRLRHKIERDPAVPEFLHTVRGVGYNFRPPLERTGDQHALLRPEFGDSARELGRRENLID